MDNLLPIPNPDRVREACNIFDQKSKTSEDALSELFSRFPENTNEGHVLLKVVALNRLYSAGVLAVEDVARHIYKNGEEVDNALTTGEQSIVDMIAIVAIKDKGFNFFSFATKYCNWHKPDLYAIYDSRVDQYLWSLQLHNRFTDIKHRFEIRNDYATFHKIMIDFRNYYKLNSFNFKDIDKFLWTRDGSASATKGTAPIDAIKAEPRIEL